ncbi:L,D-transpeptidase family protein [uncultured Tateyamaria sp.]|uniref:L,D-transpeptidase family protein n=1 Tax=uncultured Tateyamaria sp. TaxID=455651 RepID=UPI0026380638|nr:L,D-transpeptidase family protein [uncultured Tateyamaria sp.]
MPDVACMRRWVLRGLSVLVIIWLAWATQTQAEGVQHDSDHAQPGFDVPQFGKAILVNIPAFELIAFENGTPVLRSRVIVGTPWHRTPRLRTHVSSVRFRPTWRPTPSMIASGEYPDRVWPPGERNPLGLAAVRLGTGLLVYLHDTNRRELFEQDDRALSHGCVRVQKWAELAAFVLSVNLREVLRHAHGTRTFDAPAPPIPVELGYYTRFPDASGQIVTYPDIYGLQGALGLSDDVPPVEDLACLHP